MFFPSPGCVVFTDWYIYIYLFLSVIIVYVRGAMATPGFLCTLMSWCMCMASTFQHQQGPVNRIAWEEMELYGSKLGWSRAKRPNQSVVCHMQFTILGGLICQPQPIIASVLFASSFLVPKFVCLLGQTVSDSNLHIWSRLLPKVQAPVTMSVGWGIIWLWIKTLVPSEPSNS